MEKEGAQHELTARKWGMKPNAGAGQPLPSGGELCRSSSTSQPPRNASSASIDTAKMQLKTQNYTLLPQGEADPLQPSPSSFANRRKQWNRRRIWTWAIPITLAVIFTLALIGSQLKSRGRDKGEPWPVPVTGKAACPQFPALKTLESLEGLEKEVGETIGSDEFFDKSLKRMQGAVRIPTESFDDMGPVGEDPRWDVFKEFHAYLEASFPLV